MYLKSIVSLCFSTPAAELNIEGAETKEAKTCGMCLFSCGGYLIINFHGKCQSYNAITTRSYQINKFQNKMLTKVNEKGAEK